MTVKLCARSARTCIDAQLDEDEATLLFVGLLDNAIKYGRKGGTVQAAVRVLAASCEVDIDDDGPGVAEADRVRIFEFGQRGGGDMPGWGIGLSRARSLLEAHGGHICVEGSPYGGARFTVACRAQNRAFAMLPVHSRTAPPVRDGRFERREGKPLGTTSRKDRLGLGA